MLSINKSIYVFVAAILLFFAAMDMARAQGDPTPTPAPTEDYYTCIWIDDRWVCMDAEPMVTPTPTQIQLQPISRCVIVNCVYVPFVAHELVVTGDTR